MAVDQRFCIWSSLRVWCDIYLIWEVSSGWQGSLTSLLMASFCTQTSVKESCILKCFPLSGRMGASGWVSCANKPQWEDGCVWHSWVFEADRFQTDFSLRTRQLLGGKLFGVCPRRGNAGGTVAMQVHGHAFISSSILLFPFIVRPAFYTRLKRISTDYKQRANQISWSLKDPRVPSPHPSPCHMSWWTWKG